MHVSNAFSTHNIFDLQRIDRDVTPPEVEEGPYEFAEFGGGGGGDTIQSIAMVNFSNLMAYPSTD